ncbi:50S ribosomal protein L25/general stress protein Ctc [Advenella kashmirensis WT001]|uniref:Large ribosomal subunit protein bL25 n=1 Tax=Advenella kashmirensis (strain DSM 17095 / LMG 22695 / WT001) TaxID=1036672 RepID=I3UFP0_ADVKW|nr:50S ribosomal protein L25/general stress protein Ctc [Advenella kashmirensis]AFK63828.1 50S ribosomal protein L25/general stress protein Ctc [Advenella kashmirensis WT001]
MKFEATTRSVQGSSASRRLRRAGRVPAIVYGGKGEAQSIELDHNEIFHALRKEPFHTSVLDMMLDGKKQTVLLRAVQWHSYKPLVLHVDFQRVSANEALTTRIPFHFINGDESPAVKQQGATISHVLNDIEITCLPKDLPQFIEVDLGNLQANEVVHLSDVKVPAGVEFVGVGEESPVLATATVITESVEEDAAEADDTAADAEKSDKPAEDDAK